MTYALHGMLGSVCDWEGFDVQAVDLWTAFDQGDSPDLSDWARDLNQQAKVEAGGILTGYSMGGRLALHALLEPSSRWSAGLVISTHPGLVDEEQKKVRWQGDFQWASQARELPWTDFLAKWNQQVVLRSGAGSKGQMGLQSRRESIARAFECWSLGRQQDLRPALAACHTPVLWITGERDEKFTALAAEVVADNENFEQVVIAGAGHRLLFENESVLKKLKMVIGDFQKRIL